MEFLLHDLVLEALYCGINLVLSRTLLQANDAVLRTSRLFFLLGRCFETRTF